MHYVIVTLEMEIVRLEKAIREYQANPGIEFDERTGMIRDFEDRQWKIRNAIEILRKHFEEHRDEFDPLDNTDGISEG